MACFKWVISTFTVTLTQMKNDWLILRALINTFVFVLLCCVAAQDFIVINNFAYKVFFG